MTDPAVVPLAEKDEAMRPSLYDEFKAEHPWLLRRAEWALRVRGLVERRGRKQRRRGVTHRCPDEGSGLMPCCGRTPFEVPRTDRLTIDGPVTCRG